MSLFDGSNVPIFFRVNFLGHDQYQIDIIYLFYKVLQSWPVKTTVFDGIQGLNGPVPTLCAEQPEELRSRLLRFPDHFMLQLNKFMKT
jgi:hypothetical protein